MRAERRRIVSCVLLVALSMVLGCDRKSGDQSPTGTTGGAAQTESVDTGKPVEEIQAQAQTMTVDDLKAMAVKYKEAILAKQAEVEKLAAKIREVPLAEALGQEAKTLKTDLENIQTSLAALKDRFQVYYNTLKEKGGDLSGLAL